MKKFTSEQIAILILGVVLSILSVVGVYFAYKYAEENPNAFTPTRVIIIQR